ncbi:SDR family NAD(P)-dependent oxidoreductase [Streptomyces parvulus]|uniref:SDR family NAD(P)-dependent oxidoreductase n=1 Tax=Streptomyces parvulus TaxID=146923 RepID=UPI003451F569
MSELTGKTALTTGSTTSVGRATAYAPAARGASMAALMSDAQRGAKVVKQIQTDGGAARFITADLPIQ